ncbi:FAD-dependent monooxygenase [Streptomyces sp. DH37]|uniref:oxidoreductase n=1 Tax=Streptomyces sp. DH37 TaxID=3040122 RepID=UPI002442BE7B|nr:FAD-dependent monooxygenase [Streptomyces sp. DH37]MDG9701988.1 FAD-dependent monooxygenase [Streptomyces sp. DH37]
MHVHVVGGGPAGLVFAQVFKEAAPHAEVVVSDRSGGRCPRGLGVLLSQSTRRRLREVAPEAYRELEADLVRWDVLEVRRGGERIAMHGHDYAAVSRPRLLAALGDRCESLGVVLKTEDVERPLEEADLVVAAEGVNSTVRARLADPLGAEAHTHTPRFHWFGTPRLFHCLTFVVVDGPAGLFQAHAYPIDHATSAFIVQCGEESWYEAGFDTATPEEAADRCAEIFREALDGEPLLTADRGWRRFATVRCRRLSAGRVAVVGDAAHTVHWSIGSGTKVAVDDGAGLARAVSESRSLEEGLARYELARHGPVERLQRAAARSADYFDNLDRFRAQPPPLFAFNLFTRSGRLNHKDVWARDPRYAARYERWFAGRGGGNRLLVPPPAHAPITVRGVELANRAVARVPVRRPGGDPAARVRSAAAGRPGLLLLDRLAVSGNGALRGAPVLDGEGAQALGRLVRAAREGGASAVGVVLDHAGPSAGRGWSAGGRPDRAPGPHAVAASALPADASGRAPRALPEEETGRVVTAFVSAAGAALEAGADALFVNMAHGNLLATFVSPLLNHRTDRYGGSARRRAGFPAAVAAAVRRAHPSVPLGAVVSAADGVRGGTTLADAAVLVERLCQEGVDMIVVEAGQGTDDALVWSDHGALLGCADGLRAAGAPVLVLGGLTLDADELNTAVGAGRADLCVVERL